MVERFRLLLLLGAAGGVHGHGWIVDPAFYDHDISDYICNASSPACPIMRNCTYDPVLSADPKLNGTCPATGCSACLHKQLWPPAPGDFLTGGLLITCGVLAGASGIGGGGLNFPLLMLAGSFLVEEAGVLSHVAVFGNAIAQNLINSRRSHPHTSARPLADFDVPLLLLPAQLGGNALGVLIGPSLPPTGVQLLAVVLLLFASFKTIRTAVKSFKKESAEAAAAAAAANGGFSVSAISPKQLRDPLMRVAPSGGSAPLGADAAGGAAGELPITTTLQQQGSMSAAAFPSITAPMRKLGALFSLWLALVLLFLGSNYYASGKGKCAPSRLAFIFAELSVVVLVAGLAASWLVRDQRRRDDDAAAVEESGIALEGGGAAEKALPGDLRWTAKNSFVLPCVGAAIGMVAGLLGLGGGELMAPLLLVVGMLPQVASATSALMVLFTASSNVVHYLIKGALTAEPGYVSAALVIGFCSALCGRLLALRLVRKLSHPSLIAFVLSGVLLVAFALLIVDLAQAKIDWSFYNLCSK